MYLRRVQLVTKVACVLSIVALLFAPTSLIAAPHPQGEVPPISGPRPTVVDRGEAAASQSPSSPAGPLAYCSSAGGSTAYESITGVHLAGNPDGTLRLIVDVYIANPQGCTAGSPCPSYDPSPEYVNAWIDWNGNEAWEESERVMDLALTGYLNINYRGTMTAISQFSRPQGATNTPTMLRANLGWNHDPNDPCEPYWTWGNVYDMPVHPAGVTINSITMIGVGTPGSMPEVNATVRVQANLTVPPDYQVTGCAWAGDLTPGAGDASNYCRYEYTPPVGTHGSKNISLVVSFRHVPSGITGTASATHAGKLFFSKSGDYDGDSVPNWFEYWRSDNAVPGMSDADVTYDTTYGPGTYGAWYYPPDDTVHMGAAAAETHYPGGINVPAVTGCPGHNFGGARGIDDAAEVVAHEHRHKTDYHNWDAGGAWAGLTDSDDPTPGTKHNRPADDLPDTYEATLGTSSTTIDSCNLATYKSPTYAQYGDNEWDAMTASDGLTGTAANDWANPGKQSTPPFAADTTAPAVPADQSRSGVMSELSGYHSPSHSLAASPASLTGVYSSSGVDSDGDGKFNNLKLSAGLQVNQAGLYNIVAWLVPSGGSTPFIWAGKQGNLAVGPHTVDVLFDGVLINKSAKNGPYRVARVEVRLGENEDLVDAANNPYITGGYVYTDFQSPAVALGPVGGATTVDSDQDGLYDELNFNVPLTTAKPGSYTIVAQLDGPGAPIDVYSVTTSLAAGASTIPLHFMGTRIFQSHQAGTFSLHALHVVDASGKTIDFTYQAADVPGMNWQNFEHGGTFIGSNIGDEVLDANGDGDFDYLAFHTNVVAAAAGTYHLQATLSDAQGYQIADAGRDMYLNAGTSIGTLEFAGTLIRAHGKNGPYRVTGLALFNLGGALLDQQNTPYMTGAYDYTSFSLPLVTLGTTFSANPRDTNGNGLYDWLDVTVPIIPGDPGVITAKARLTGPAGQEIQWAEVSTAVSVVGSTVDLTLPFSGTVIMNHHISGPYRLADLLVYNTGDPSQSVFAIQPFSTAAYSVARFEGAERLYLPLIRRYR